MIRCPDFCYRRWLWLTAFGLLLAAGVQAETACPLELRQQSEGGSLVRLLVYEFEPGRFDLAMQVGEPATAIHRISHSGRDAQCAYQPLALERGGDWGWHLLWLEPGRGVYYARMDGDAWVSSPKKRLADDGVRQVRFRADGSHLYVIWLDADGRRQTRQSLDEGRSWD
ncbi:MAG TPA: hypothetical protein VIK69_00020 [Methylophilaceae bacterium]|jgi:hypothetical protein